MSIPTHYQIPYANSNCPSRRNEWSGRMPKRLDRQITFHTRSAGYSCTCTPRIGLIGEYVVLLEPCNNPINPDKYYKVALFLYRSPIDTHAPRLHTIKYIKGDDLTNRDKLMPTSKFPKVYEKQLRREYILPKWDKKLSEICELGITRMGSSYKGFTTEYIKVCLKLLSQIPEPVEFKEEWKVFSKAYVSNSFGAVRARSRMNDYLQPN